MSQLNTLDLRDKLISRICEFSLDEHFVNDNAVRKILRDIWKGCPQHGGLGSDLWIEGVFPPMESNKTLLQLAQSGVLSENLVRHLDKNNVFPLGRHLFTHQLASILASHELRNNSDKQPALVITASTGAGKTESFLLPLLDRLWRSNPIPGNGVSAILLYPLNALVNDQVDRLEKWLQGQNKITFCHFTSETPENKKKADELGLPPASSWRFRTRQQARGLEGPNGEKLSSIGTQPQILVTNYSMLEYMLCRPQDAIFFGSNLQVIVLDEAHIYSGNLAAEITLLMRRLQMRCNKKPEEILHIATSATIGGDEQALKPFASKLFTKDESIVQVISGQRSCPQFQVKAPEDVLSFDLAEKLISIPEEETLQYKNEEAIWHPSSENSRMQWRQLIHYLTISDAPKSNQTETGPLLAQALSYSPAMAKLQQILWNDNSPTRFTLEELAIRLFGNVTEVTAKATRSLLQMGALARNTPNAWPLVPNRVHYIMRGPEGLMLSLSEHSPDEAARYLNGRGHIYSAGADPSCFDGRTDYPLTMMRCPISGWWGVAGLQKEGKFLTVPSWIVLHSNDEHNPVIDDEMPAETTARQVKFFSLNEVEGAKCWLFDPATGSYSAKQDNGIPLWEVTHCPECGMLLELERVGWFSAPARLQISLIAETALAAMSEFPHDNKRWKPARGRRLLVFSDSRTEAARLGPRLTRQHEMQLFRTAVITEIVQRGLQGNEESLNYLYSNKNDLTIKLINNKNTSIEDRIRRDLEVVEQEIRNCKMGGSVKDWVKYLSESPIIEEIYHPATGETHDPFDKAYERRWRENNAKIKDNIDKLLGRELAQRPTWPYIGLETLGLIEIIYPRLEECKIPNKLLGCLRSEIRTKLTENWTNFLASILDALRNQGCITLGQDRDDHDYQYGASRIGKRFSANDSYKGSLIPLIGEHVDGNRASRRNVFTREMLIASGMSWTEAVSMTKYVMQSAFDTLLENKSILDWLNVTDAETNSGNTTTALQINFLYLCLRSPSELFQCQTTGQVWPRSVLGLYPGAKSPSLIKTSSDMLDDDNRIGRRRKELRHWEGFKMGLWAEEHSAQLSPKENARLQNLFRLGLRNILSSTTTLELGIDIGGLNAVLMGNLPPGKASYLQRAGRAGRRADGSCAVLGFARPTSYERMTFLDFKRYLDSDLLQPTVFLDRSAIVKRHSHAWLLGDFFRSHHSKRHTGAMEAYGKMFAFTGIPTVQKWKNNTTKPEIQSANKESLAEQFFNYLDILSQKPQPEMIEKLKNLWQGCAELEEKLSVNEWPNFILTVKTEFEKAVLTWRENINSLTNAWKEADDKAQANAIYYQLLALYHLTVIETLADSRVLPRYGFPIGQSRLRVQSQNNSTTNKSFREEDQYRLQRNSMLAMSEYAPGSQVLVGGKVVTSRGLLKHWTGEVYTDEAWGLRGRFKRNSSGFFHYSINAEAPLSPPANERYEEGLMLFPKNGFCTANHEELKTGINSKKVGRVEAWTIEFEDASNCDQPLINFGGIKGCTAIYRHGGELLLLNSGAYNCGYAICQKCGYADSEWKQGGKGRMNLPNHFENHIPLNASRNSKICLGKEEAPVWRNHHLAARHPTHMLKIDFSGYCQSLNQNLLLTLAQALRIAAVQILALDCREIMVLKPMREQSSKVLSSLILYDSLAGGAGHLAELCHRNHPERAEKWIEQTISILNVSTLYSQNAREREAIRRILTADCQDQELVPLEALDFLMSVRSYIKPTNPQIQTPDDAWTLEKLLQQSPPDEFNLFYPLNDIRGLAAGTYSCQRLTTPPKKDSIVILKDQRLPNGIGMGRWFAQQQNEMWVVKLRNTNNNYCPLTYSISDFTNLSLLTVISEN